VVAPVALFVAIVYTLNRLNTDSELVVMAASGISRVRLARPFLLLSLIVAVLSAALSLYLAPESMARLRLMVTKVRADIISTIVRDGRFTEIEKGITFHVREKSADGSLLGLLVHDERDPKRVMTYLAERGQILELPQGTFLVMQSGAIQRRDQGRPDATIIAFQSYALDLSQFAAADDDVYFKPRERSTLQLVRPDRSSPQHERVAGKIRGELHERLSAPLYPIAVAFMILAFLGDARTSRQSQISALVGLTLSVMALRASGFGISSLVVQDAAAVPLVYLAPVVAIAISMLLARGGGLEEIGAWMEGLAGRAIGLASALLGRAPRLEGAE
jgi:lipopolysaccharide export system permease protein